MHSQSQVEYKAWDLPFRSPAFQSPGGLYDTPWPGQTDSNLFAHGI